MARVPRVRGTEMIRFLETKGFGHVRTKGSHYVLKNSRGKIVVVPVHGSEVLGRGLTRKILQDADIPIKEFITYFQ